MVYKYGKRTRNFWGRFYFILFYFGFLSFGSVMNKIVTLLALVRYEMFTAKSALYAQCSLSIISHPTGVHGIIFSN